MTDNLDPMAEIKASFFIECEELLEALQDGLQSLDDGDDGGGETINIVFRAVHSIKGGAGAFGLEALVRFAHRYETALDEVRSGKLTPDDNANKLFFQAADHLSDLVRICRDSGEIPEERSDELGKELDVLIGKDGTEEVEEEISFQPMGLSLDMSGLGEDISSSTVSSNIFKITFKPTTELFETGNEPYYVLKSLGELGVCETQLLSDDIPNLAQLSPGRPDISWTVTITTEADEAELNSVFEFVDGLCDLLIETASLSDDEAPSQAHVEVAAESVPEPEVAQPVMIEEPAEKETPPKKPEPHKAKPKADSTGKSKQTAAAKSVVRVDLDRIERLVNLVGELVINQAMLSQSLEQAGLSPHSDAMNGLEEFQRLTRDIQDSVMMIRAQPVKALFQRMSRIVRESSAAVGKDVRLISIGENTEVDKTVIERLADPLTHMIRNAVDHGLEETEKRVESGKSEQGIVRLSASHKSGRVVIDVSDDGGGINRPKVFDIAVSKGLVPEDANLSDSEIDNLLFLPGFSTAKEVSDLSGRGVGMDVVRTAIQALGGRITITSIPGEGTTFSISLPLTLAVLDGMVVDVAEETLVVPLNLVIETLTLNDLHLDMIRPGVMSVRIRGEFIPVYDLGVALGYRAPLDDPTGCVVLLILQEDGQRSALLIDQIRDQRQVVIKGLDDTFYRAPGIAAATILGDGQIALILDPTDIITQANLSTSRLEVAEATGS